MRMLLLPLIVLLGLKTAAVAEAFKPFTLGPFSRNQDVNGVIVSLRTRVEVSADPDDASSVHARFLIDLGELQEQIPAIVATFPLPRDNCASYKLDNLVVSIHQAALDYKSGAAVFSLGGRVVAWTCVENPINGKPLMKTEVGSQSFSAALPFGLQAAGEKAIELIIGMPTIDIEGKYAGITRALLEIADIDINALALEAIAKAIGPEDLLVSVPAELQAIEPVVQSATFGEQDGRLFADVRLKAKPGPAILAAFLQALGR